MLHNKYCDKHIAEHSECGHPHSENGHCEYSIWAPDRHTSVNNLAFSAYAYHTTQIEELIDRLAQEDDPNDPWVQNRICCDLGISLNHLTASEISYIEEEVSKRL